MQSLGKIVLRAPAVACKCENVLFVCFFLFVFFLPADAAKRQPTGNLLFNVYTQ